MTLKVAFVTLKAAFVTLKAAFVTLKVAFVTLKAAFVTSFVLTYSRLQIGEVQIIVGAHSCAPLPVYFIYLKNAVSRCGKITKLARYLTTFNVLRLVSLQPLIDPPIAWICCK